MHFTGPNLSRLNDDKIIYWFVSIDSHKAHFTFSNVRQFSDFHIPGFIRLFVYDSYLRQSSIRHHTVEDLWGIPSILNNLSVLLRISCHVSIQDVTHIVFKFHLMCFEALGAEQIFNSDQTSTLRNQVVSKKLHFFLDATTPVVS